MTQGTPILLLGAYGLAGEAIARRERASTAPKEIAPFHPASRCKMCRVEDRAATPGGLLKGSQFERTPPTLQVRSKS